MGKLITFVKIGKIKNKCMIWLKLILLKQKIMMQLHFQECLFMCFANTLFTVASAIYNCYGAFLR